MQEKKIDGFTHMPYSRDTYEANEMIQRSQEFFSWMDKRRTVRDIGTDPVPKQVIQNIILSASTAPSGAHKQPWTFCAVSNYETKVEIREAAEKEEYESYTSRMSERWLEDLQPIGTDWKKPFLEEAPWLIIVFKKIFDLDETGQKSNNYYVNESVGIACGMLLTAIHNAGLVTVTHTPSPMNFLSRILERPDNERPFLLLPIGYPKKEALVPKIKRKDLDKIANFYD